MQESIRSGGQLDGYAERLRLKLPTAPENVANGYVQWAPWLAIVFGVIGLLGFLSLFLLGAALTPLLAWGGAAALRYGGMAMVGALLGAGSSVLDVLGGYLMLRRRLVGWWLLALGLAVSMVTNLFSVAIVGLAIALLVAWIHLQVKPRYS
jgi:hypothetical protein